MSLGVAIFLGVLQGLTEFFPVSSSGHLALFGHWFGLHEPDLTFDILLHLATLAAIVVYFRKDWVDLWNLCIGEKTSDFPKHLLPYLILSIIPAGLVGVFLKDHIEALHGYPYWVGIFLFVTGITLLCGLRIKGEGRPFEQLSPAMVAVIALAQAVAILPGISRSGATIMAALFLGMNKNAAARFSFLMAVPVIGGAGLLALIKVIAQSAAMSTGLWLAYGAGFVSAMVSGFFALAFLMRLLEGKRFFYFGFYCLAMGAVAVSL